MQLRPLRIALLLAAGFGLAVVVTWVLGWFAAIALPIETVRIVASSPILAFLVFSVAMNLLPAVALGFFAGRLLSALAPTSPAVLAFLASLPWLAYATLGSLFFFYPPEVTLLQRLAPLLSWQVWLSILAMPLGLWVGAAVIRPNSPGNGHAPSAA